MSLQNWTLVDDLLPLFRKVYILEISTRSASKPFYSFAMINIRKKIETKVS
jgi:hypothetical protein